MKFKIFFIALIGSAVLLTASQSVPVTWNGEFKTGTLAEEVLKIKGEPTRKVGPVGDPAVEKWYYGNEVVVIMDGYVIDSFYIKWQG